MSRPEPLPVPDAAIERLAAAVRIPTISYDDPNQRGLAKPAFGQFADFLRQQFPRVHRQLQLEGIGESSLLFRWQGVEQGLPPILLMAHMDVVPADPATLDQWTHPPFAGACEDGFVWGRGSMDDKACLMGILEAVEMLLAGGFAPRRGIYLAFGEDEEILGQKGAAQIAGKLLAEGRKFAFILDEGLCIMEGMLPNVAEPIAYIGVGEKGYLTLELRVHQDGGHSSMPKPQTAIGILSAALSRLESHPLPLRMIEPIRRMFARLRPSMPFLQRLVFGHMKLFRNTVLNKLAAAPTSNALVRTTTACTMFHAGIKENILPAEAVASVNFRILPGDTCESVIAHVRKVARDPRIQVREVGQGSDPSGVTDANSQAFALVGKAVSQVFPDAVVTPGLVVGATDSRHYASLTGSVLRFMPIRLGAEDMKRIHGIDERIGTEDYRNCVRFYHRLIAAACQWDESVQGRSHDKQE